MMNGISFAWLAGTPTRDASLQIVDSDSRVERMLVIFRGAWGAFDEEKKARLLAAIFTEQAVDAHAIDLANQLEAFLTSPGGLALGPTRQAMLADCAKTLRAAALGGVATNDTELARAKRVLAYVLQRVRGFAISDLEIAAQDLDLDVITRPAPNGQPARELYDARTVISSLQAELNAERVRAEALAQMVRGEYWFWQGDGTDHLESLTGQVVISAEALRKLQAGAPA